MRSLFCVAFVFTSILVGSFSSVSAQLPNGWRQHDYDRPLPPVVQPGEAALPVPPPSDAVVLFDGTDLSAWRSGNGGEAKWVIVDGVMESVAGSGYVFTKEEFGDCQLHVEWASPANVKGNSQGRGNSGVFLMGKYEVQVLDSFDNRTYADGSAGSIYGQYPPLVNASRGPGQWQSYDIVFRRPRFSGDGSLASPPRLTVFHNGLVIQDASEPFGPTGWLKPGTFDDKSTRGPLSLQDHGNPVRYRNIWIRPLDEKPRPAPVQAYATESIELSDDQLDALVGKYGMHTVKRDGGGLKVKFGGSQQKMIATSPTTFQTRYTAATFTFELGDDGKAIALTREFGGDRSRAKKD